MNKKLKVILIVLVCFAIVLSVTLILLSLGRIEIGEVGLSYDNIVAQYSSEQVYGPGLHFIGIASTFIRIKQIPTILNLEIQNAFTSDYYSLESKLIVTYQLTSINSFSEVDTFYKNFGEPERAEGIMASVMKMKVFSILSGYTSSEYQNTQNFISTLEETIRASLARTFLDDLDVSLTLTVLIESLIVDGVESNIEQVTDQIDQMQGQLERAEKEQVQLSSFIERALQRNLQELYLADSIIEYRTDLMANLINLYGASSPNISKILFGNQAARNNLSFTSSELLLRPQLYTLNTTVIF